RDVHRNRRLDLRVFLGLDEVAELEPEHHASAVMRSDQRFVDADFERSGEHVVEGLNQPKHSARTIFARPMALQIAEVPLDVRVAPHPDLRAAADLIDDASVRLEERLRADVGPVQHREILETLGAEHADLATAKEEIQHEGSLAQPAAILKFA